MEDNAEKSSAEGARESSGPFNLLAQMPHLTALVICAIIQTLVMVIFALVANLYLGGIVTYIVGLSWFLLLLVVVVGPSVMLHTVFAVQGARAKLVAVFGFILVGLYCFAAIFLVGILLPGLS